MKSKSRKNEVQRGKSGHKNTITVIRDWLGFMLTAAGFFLSLLGMAHVQVSCQCVFETEVQQCQSPQTAEEDEKAERLGEGSEEKK